MPHVRPTKAPAGRAARVRPTKAPALLQMREGVSGRTQIHLSPPRGVKEVGAQFLDRFGVYMPLPDQN
jgi:hypothetical protein